MRRALLLAALALACPAPGSQGSAPPVVHAVSMPSGGPPPAFPAEPTGAPAIVGAGKPALPTNAVTTPGRPADLPPAFVDAADKIAAVARGRTRAWELLAVLSDNFGHRLSGSRSLERAIDWSIDQLQKDGLTGARREKVMVPKWVRGSERARVVSPIERDLVILGLGGTVGTRGPLRGEIAVVDALTDIDARGAELRGKIVVINQPMPRFDHENHDSGYGTTVQIRGSGASAAAKHGAKAVLIRSVTANSLRSPHTGALRYDDKLPKIPAAALTLEDAELLSRLARKGKTTVELSLGAKTLPDSESANAIAELRGRELPDEIVLIGGHIDSWDVGDGSTDDGAGCIMAIEAAALLKELGLVPRRTIRVVLFTNEENGLRGAKAYHAAHGTEKHVAAIEADSGAGAPRGFGVGGTPEQLAELQRYAPLFDALGASAFEAGGGGADIGPLMKDGVLGLGLHPDTSAYFDLHHSPADTFDKVDPDHLERNAAAMALMAYILAER